jgi:hypothetical protein
MEMSELIWFPVSQSLLGMSFNDFVSHQDHDATFCCFRVREIALLVITLVKVTDGYVNSYLLFDRQIVEPAGLFNHLAESC